MKPIEAITKPLLDRIEHQDKIISKLKEELTKKDEQIEKLIIAFADKQTQNNNLYVDSNYLDPTNPHSISKCPCCDSPVKLNTFSIACADCWNKNLSNLYGVVGGYNSRKRLWEIGHNKVKPQTQDDIELPF